MVYDDGSFTFIGNAGINGLRSSAISASWFMMMHFVVLPLTRHISPVFHANLEKRGKLIEWRNYTVSYTFIWSCSIALVYILYHESDTMLSDLLGAKSERCKNLIAFSLGYFIADTFDMWRGSHLSTDMVFHHGIIILCYSTSVYLDTLQPYLVATLIAETNTIFLHARKLMLLAGVKKETFAYKSAISLLFLGFPCQRVFPHLWLLSNIYSDGVAGRFPEKWMFYLAFSGMLIINFLNFVLLKGLLLAEQGLIFGNLRLKYFLKSSKSKSFEGPLSAEALD